MDWIPVTARTIEEAKELALDRLGVVEDELEYEVLEERRGLLGRFGAEVKIRARVKPVSREKPGDRRQRRRRPERGPRGDGGGGRSDRPTRERADRAPAEAADRDPASGGQSRRRSRTRSRSGGRRERRPETPEVHEVATMEAEPVNESTVPIDEQAQAAARFTEELVGHFGVRADVRAEVVDDDIEVRVEGSGLGVLVGPRGATLQALEELTRAVLQHVAGGHSARLHLDVAGYRQRRREALAEFAIGVAKDVLATGRGRSLEPMPAPDRKVVHDAVATVEGVVTTSEGEEPRRRVVIRPA